MLPAEQGAELMKNIVISSTLSKVIVGSPLHILLFIL